MGSAHKFAAAFTMVLVWVCIIFSGCGAESAPKSPRTSLKSIDANPETPAVDSVLPTDQVSPDPGTSLESAAQKVQMDLLREILPTCGISNFDNFRTEKLSDQTIESAPWLRNGKGGLLGAQDYTYSLAGQFVYDATFERVVSSANITLKSSGSVLGKDRGELEAKSRTGVVTATISPLEQRHILKATSPEWNDVYCTAQAAARTTNTMGGKRVVSEFSPPLPFVISPKANRSKYAAELGDSKAWNQIAATIIESNDTGMPAGKVVRGTARIDKVAPTASILAKNGDVVAITADEAFKITYNFNSAAQTAALGLPASITFYIDATSRRYKAVVRTTAGDDTVTISQVAE